MHCFDEIDCGNNTRQKVRPRPTFQTVSARKVRERLCMDMCIYYIDKALK